MSKRRNLATSCVAENCAFWEGCCMLTFGDVRITSSLACKRIAALQAKNAEFETARVETQKHISQLTRANIEVAKQNASLRPRITELEAALEPLSESSCLDCIRGCELAFEGLEECPHREADRLLLKGK